MIKQCNKCKETKNVSEFFKDKNNLSDGHYSICKVCKQTATLKYRAMKKSEYNEYMQKYREKHPEQYQKGRVRSLRNRYGITQNQYNEILDSQGGTCALCSAKPGKRPFYVDQRHSDGDVRGILCPGHNRSIALLDDVELMKKALEYNENPPAKYILKKSA